jgi:hypothetical protein
MMFLPKTNSFIAMTIVAISLTAFVFGEITTTNVIIDNKRRALKKGKGKKDKKTSNNKKLACNKKLFEGDWKYGVDERTFGIDIKCKRNDCSYTEFEIFNDGTADEKVDPCVLGGPFIASSKIEFDRSTGICNLSYIDIIKIDPCNLLDGTLLGLKAEINIKDINDDGTMSIRFSDDGAKSFYNDDDPRLAARTKQ